MAMQKNRNLFQLSLIRMFIFVCFQCLSAKGLPTTTPTILPVKSTINSTVQSPTVKHTGEVVPTTQILTLNKKNNVSSPLNKTSIPTLKGLTDKTSSNSIVPTADSPGFQKPTITTTNDNKSSVSPKITESPSNKTPDELTTINTPDLQANKTSGESTTNKTSDLTTRKTPDVSTTKKTSDLTTSKTSDVSTNKSLPTISTTSKKSLEEDHQNKTLPIKNPYGKEDQSVPSQSTTTTTKKPDKKPDLIGLNKSTTTQSPAETQDQGRLDKLPTTQKQARTQDQSKLDKKTTESANENVQNNMPGSKISPDMGENDDRKQDENKKPMNSGTLYEDDEDTGGHFMAYFITFVVICIAGYIIYHNKQKILAFILEGKKDGSRRRPNSKEYKRLKTDEVMPSLEKNTSDNKYIY
ncbi:trans-Golgi network integral membrane protein TGN38-like [Mytilus edulis]|uniref:trans-Golgi network integral membrane protein TGN38-like n=1 Tax=Mytilus edulis TaxID=6550 RepID=UPI0039F02FC6